MMPTFASLRLRAFNTTCQISVENTDSKGDALLSLAKAELRRLEVKFGSSSAAGIIGQLNRFAGSARPVPLDGEARSLFNFASALWQQSNHQFDPSLAALDHGSNKLDSTLGTAAPGSTGLAQVGWGNLELATNGARLTQRGMRINLDSCVRPYAVDSIRRIFIAQGVSSAQIDLNDDIATIGKQADGANWLVGVKHPKSSGVAITRLKLNNSGYAIRGDFERCLTIDGERFSRALSPVDGQPIPGLLCVAVMADTCLEACGAANIARVKTEPTALSWLEKIGLPWLAIDKNLQCHGLLG